MTARPTITLIEGADGVGKTYAADLREAKEIAATGKGVFRVHNGPPQTTSSSALYRFYRDQLKQAVYAREQGFSTIIDRSWPSEVIYGPVYRARSLITPRQVKRLERFAADNDIVTVGLWAPDAIRRHRIAKRGEQWDGAQIMIADRYARYFRLHRWITAGSTLASH